MNFVAMTQKDSFVQRIVTEIPKVILHTHVEGSIPHPALLYLARRNGKVLSYPYDCDKPLNWQNFLAAYSEICNCILSKDDLVVAITAYASKLCSDNVRYAELHFTPWAHLSRGLTEADIQNAVEESSARIKAYHIEIKFIFDFIRVAAEDHWRMIEWISEIKNHVVAIGFSGDTSGTDLLSYRGFCNYIKGKGFKIVAHVGELDGPRSVDVAVNILGIDRITHGIRSIEDPELFQSLVDRRLHFEICPTSNRSFGLTDNNFSEIDTIVKSGAKFSVNPDDEFLFKTNITKELLSLVDKGVITCADLPKVVDESITSSFASDEVKQQIRYDMSNYWSNCINDTNS